MFIFHYDYTHRHRLGKPDFNRVVYWRYFERHPLGFRNKVYWYDVRNDLEGILDCTLILNVRE